MTSSESQSGKEIVPNVQPPLNSALPAVIKDETDTTARRALGALEANANEIIEVIETSLLTPHPREAYLETVVSYLRDTTGSPPAPQFGMQDIQTLLQTEASTVLLSRFETLLANMKPFPDYLRGAINYLRKPTNSIVDINKHAINIGKVWIIEPRLPGVVAIHYHFLLLQYQFHRAAFEAAISPEKPQDIIKFFTSYPPLSQLRNQFAREKDNDRVQKIDGMLAYEMRLKNGAQLPESNETQNTTQLLASAETFLATGTLTNPADITMFQRILGFLRSPTDNFSDLQQRSNDIGGILADFLEDTPAALDAINLHFMGLLFAHHFKELKAAVAENPQNIQRITKAMTPVVEAAKYSDASVQQELNAFLQAHEIRKKLVKAAE